MDSHAVLPDTAGEDRRLHRSLGYWQLTAIGFSGVIGSGWLLGAMYAAQYAGPEAIVSWIIGGIVLALIALVMAALGGARPEAGGDDDDELDSKPRRRGRRGGRRRSGAKAESAAAAPSTSE